MKLHKKFERYLTAIFKLGRTEWMAKQALRRGQDLENRVGDLQNTLQGAMMELAHQRQVLSDLESGQEERFALQMENHKASLTMLLRSFSDLTARLDRLMMQGMSASTSSSAGPENLPDAPGLAAFQDQFRYQLEVQQRGDRSMTVERLKFYLPDVEAALYRTGDKKVMDLGCGQGDWVSLLADRNIPAFGVDRNAALLAEGKKAGLDLRLGDIVEALAEQDDNSLSVLSAHHLVAELPFDRVAWIVREAQRVLAPGGLLLLETARVPDPGAHLCVRRPPPPELVLGLLFETAGFHPVETRQLNAHEKLADFMEQTNVNQELSLLLFGPQDLAVLGTKPKES